MHQMTEKYPSTLLLSLCIEIHYTLFSLHVQPVSSHQWQDADEECDVQDLLHWAGSLDGDNLLLQVMVLDGHLVQPFHMICPLVPFQFQHTMPSLGMLNPHNPYNASMDNMVGSRQGGDKGHAGRSKEGWINFGGWAGGNWGSSRCIIGFYH